MVSTLRRPARPPTSTSSGPTDRDEHPVGGARPGHPDPLARPEGRSRTRDRDAARPADDHPSPGGTGGHRRSRARDRRGARHPRAPSRQHLARSPDQHIGTIGGRNLRERGTDALAEPIGPLVRFYLGGCEDDMDVRRGGAARWCRQRGRCGSRGRPRASALERALDVDPPVPCRSTSRRIRRRIGAGGDRTGWTGASLVRSWRRRHTAVSELGADRRSARLDCSAPSTLARRFGRPRHRRHDVERRDGRSVGRRRDVPQRRLPRERGVPRR